MNAARNGQTGTSSNGFIYSFGEVRQPMADSSSALVAFRPIALIKITGSLRRGSCLDMPRDE